MSTTTWPEGVIARYLTAVGGFVDLTERSGYYAVTHATETVVECHGCEQSHSVDWGFDFMAFEFNSPQPDTFDKTGQAAIPEARSWAQAHAEKCRALPKPCTH
ncbi:MAG: hypothetical protein ACTH0H_05710 [Brachybacterium sp.]